MTEATLETATRPVDRGWLIASILQGAWRAQPESVTMTEAQLQTILPILVRAGTAALAWRRIRGTPLASSEPGRQIQTARRIQAAEAAIRQADLEQVLALPAIHEADPVLLKGWAHGQLYPEPAVRHYTDIDLLIQPAFLESVSQALATLVPADPARAAPIDLQTAAKDLPERSWAQLLAHSRVLSLPRGQVRALGFEDTLRLSCIHMMRHLSFHPLWLCDASVLVENLPSGFDWDYCLNGDRRRTDWMLSVLRLANQTLGTRLDRCPERRLPRAVPPWMVRAMLRWWGNEATYIYPWPLPDPIGSVAREDPRRLLQVFADRWPDPLQAVSRYSWPLNRVSGKAAQIRDFVGRALTWAPRHAGRGALKP
jgi:Uncharacterised nucleotidyltransferase